MAYGSTPEFLKDAPFSLVLVPRGFHTDNKCLAYWVNQAGEHGETDNNQVFMRNRCWLDSFGLALVLYDGLCT